MAVQMMTPAEFVKDFVFKLVAFFVGLAAGLAVYATVFEPLYQLFN